MNPGVRSVKAMSDWTGRLPEDIAEDLDIAIKALEKIEAIGNRSARQYNFIIPKDRLISCWVISEHALKKINGDSDE